jgi:hypothetical protein
MIDAWTMWLIFAGLAIGVFATWLLLVRLPRGEDDVSIAERRDEARWIGATIERHGGVAPLPFVEEVLDLHQAYLRTPRAAADAPVVPASPAQGSPPIHAQPAAATPGLPAPPQPVAVAPPGGSPPPRGVAPPPTVAPPPRGVAPPPGAPPPPTVAAPPGGSPPPGAPPPPPGVSSPSQGRPGQPPRTR